MPIFSRRRIQSMLDDMRPVLAAKKVNDLIQRLSDAKRPEQVIGAEMELSLLWGIRQVARLEVDPALPNSTRVPEAYSEDFFGAPSYIEVTTVSDGKLAGEAHMQRAAQKMVQFANTHRKKTGKFLYFSFAELNYWEGNQYFREHHIAPDFELTDIMQAQMRAWLDAPEFAKTSLHLLDASINVTITSKAYPQKAGFNYFSSLPPLAYDIEENPLFTALKGKAVQLSAVPDRALKVIFIADGGSRLLRRLTDRDNLRQYKSGEEIIGHFLRKQDIDAVCVFSPLRKQSIYDRSPPQWRVTFFESGRRPIPTRENLEKLVRDLPPPRFEGYQARSIQRQSAFAPSARGWYLGSEIASGKERITMKVSARLLQEYLAGRIPTERFHENSIGETSAGKNLFEHWLTMGYTISGASFESAGVDKDDDRVVFEFRRDPAAAEFK
jgi:hypothetical protein